MVYSIVGIIAIAIHIIVNFDIFKNVRGKIKFSGEKYYFFFLLSVIAYHITDGFWGILYDNKLVIPVFIDTTIYFVAMAVSILLWGVFVFKYLGARGTPVLFAGVFVFTVQIIFIIINFFTPVLFTVSEDCVYNANTGRYVTFTMQIAMFLLLTVYAFVFGFKTKDSLRRHYFTIGFFSVFLMVAIILQVIFPLMPFYSLGYLLGICALHGLLVEDEKMNSRHKLELAQHQAVVDSLTGVLNKHAYQNVEQEFDDLIGKHEMEPFAIVLFDLNDLKFTNDNYGHEEGDKYIKEATALIAEYFKDIPIYRVGGDEFTVILKGQDYKNKAKLLVGFNKRIDDNVKKSNRVVISAGLSSYMPEKDGSMLQTFTRADREMYSRKHQLKALKK